MVELSEECPEDVLSRSSTYLSIASLGAVAVVIVLWSGPAYTPSTLSRAARPDPPVAAPRHGGQPMHPVPGQPVRVLPQLDSSDEPVRAALAKVPGAGPLLPLLAHGGTIRRLVAAVDILARDAAAAPATGMALGEEYVRAAEAVDARGLVALYGRLYPLFQQAYEERGAAGHFNDALVRAIDNLLRDPPPDAARFEANLREARGMLALHGPPGRGQPR